MCLYNITTTSSTSFHHVTTNTFRSSGQTWEKSVSTERYCTWPDNNRTTVSQVPVMVAVVIMVMAYLVTDVSLTDALLITFVCRHWRHRWWFTLVIKLSVCVCQTREKKKNRQEESEISLVVVLFLPIVPAYCRSITRSLPSVRERKWWYSLRLTTCTGSW